MVNTSIDFNTIITICNSSIEEFDRAIEKCVEARNQHQFDPIPEISAAIDTCEKAKEECYKIMAIFETETDDCKVARQTIVHSAKVTLGAIRAVRECYAAIRKCFELNGEAESTIRILEKSIEHCEVAGQGSIDIFERCNSIMEWCQEMPEPDCPEPERPHHEERPRHERPEQERSSDDFLNIIAATTYTNMKVISEAPAMAQAFNYLNASQANGMMFNNNAHSQHHQSILEQATATKGVIQTHQADAVAKAKAMMKKFRRTPS